MLRKILFFLLANCLLFPNVWAGTSRKDAPTRIAIETTMGKFVVTLFKETPQHAANFEKLVREGFYNGTLFHRVIKNFMVQAGDPDSKTATPGQELGDGDLPYTLPLELDLPYHYHYRGALCAAREGDDVNPQRRSSATQFYIVWGKTFSDRQLAAVRQTVDTATGQEGTITPDMARTYQTLGGAPHLDGQYTVFGEVIAGLSVIKKMQNVATDKNDRPLTDIRILSATVIE